MKIISNIDKNLIRECIQKNHLYWWNDRLKHSKIIDFSTYLLSKYNVHEDMLSLSQLINSFENNQNAMKEIYKFFIEL